MCVINRRNDKVKMLRKCFDAYKSKYTNQFPEMSVNIYERDLLIYGVPS